jgi:hypothetical protein
MGAAAARQPAMMAPAGDRRAAMIDESTQVQRAAEAHVRRWQDRLLPFMLGAVIFMTVFFLLASLWVFYDFRQRVTDEKPDLAPMFVQYERDHLAKGGEPAGDYVRWKAAVLLEQDLVARRYKQVSSVILARIWTRYLGFLTGMTLALVGAFFVLGQLKTDTSTLQAKTNAVEAALSTSSPGLVLAALGTVLMAISLVVTFDFETRDVPTYMREGPAVSGRPPRPFPEADKVEPKQRTKADELIDAAPKADTATKEGQ